MLLALDGGGTKTVCLVAEGGGAVLGWGLGGPSNLSFVSRCDAEAAIESAAADALQMAKQSGYKMQIELAMCSGPVVAEVLESTVRRAVLPRSIQVVSEARSCLASADGAECGAVVLAGTGSFQYACAPNGRRHRTDGWGTVLGDEGSAYDIARGALIAVARAEDGRGPRTILQQAVLEFLGVATLRVAARRIYAEPIPRHELARLAAVVGVYAGRDEVARGILHEAALKLATGALACIRAVGLGGERFDLVLCGGVFRAGEPIVAPLVEAVRVVAPGAHPVRPRYEPVYGALRLAFQSANIPWTELISARFASTLATSGAAALVCSA